MQRQSTWQKHLWKKCILNDSSVGFSVNDHDKLDIPKGTKMALQQDQQPDGESWAVKSLWKKEIVK